MSICFPNGPPGKYSLEHHRFPRHDGGSELTPCSEKPMRSSLSILFLFPLLANGKEPDFNRDVAPILVKRCLECHLGNEPSGRLNLSTEALLKQGGREGNPLDGLLLRRVESGEMPPPKQNQSQKLPFAEIEILKTWLASGAKWPQGRSLDLYEATSEVRGGRDWWSFQPVKKVTPPRIASNPIDAFIQDSLRKRNWEPAPKADRRILLRRLSYDLLGIPPTVEEVEAFVRDESPDAYERQVDRLLASPHFGERWARHWLDVARYAETCGYERDQTKPHAWKYRDWVIDSFNRDRRFDEFIRHQLAGDEIPNRDEASVIATGFLRLGTWNDEPNDPQEYKYDRLEDMVHVTTTAFLSLTVKCARCHDHKFDPVPQVDYYKVAGAFWPGPIEPGPRELLGGPTREQLGFDAFAWTDVRRNPPPLRLLKKGDPNRPGVEVPFGLPTFASFTSNSSDAREGSSGRRLALANWIASPQNPLTPRVWVNRLWQHYFGQGLVRSPDNFGFTGEKPTHPELLEWLAGELISNDWRSKRLHRLIVTSSTYQQASIHPKQGEYAREDAGNRLGWKMDRKRLDAEGLRDALLFASGNLDANRLGGTSFLPEVSPEALEGWSRKGAEWTPSPESEQRRRTIYAFVKRGLLPPNLTLFDAPDTTLPCGQRDVTTVAPQALAMLNNTFVHRQSEALAKRAATGSENEMELIRKLWRLTLAREPSERELKLALEHLREQTQRLGSVEKARASLGHVLLNTNEFIYLD
jgi:hypothetical protein